jgi:hypothetical protein
MATAHSPRAVTPRWLRSGPGRLCIAVSVIAIAGFLAQVGLVSRWWRCADSPAVAAELPAGIRLVGESSAFGGSAAATAAIPVAGTRTENGALRQGGEVMAAALRTDVTRTGPASDCGPKPWGRLQHIADALAILIPVPDGETRRLELVRDTWARCVPNLHFVGACPGCTVPGRPGGSWFTLPATVMAMWRRARADLPNASAFFKIDLDTYVFYDNLLLSLEALMRDSNGAADAVNGKVGTGTGEWPDYLGSELRVSREFLRNPWGEDSGSGGPAVDDPRLSVRYASGGAGYLLSRAGVAAVARCKRPEENTTIIEDGLVGLCLHDAGIKLTHHPGFHSAPLDIELRAWVDPAQRLNKAGSPVVPRRVVTVHGAKDPYAFLALHVLAFARGSRASCITEDGHDGPSPWADFVGPPAFSVVTGAG